MSKPTMGLWFPLVLLCAATVEAALQPTYLRCEYKTDPQGIDVLRPRLSWQLRSDPPDRRGQRQTAYRVLVASSSELLSKNQADLWDTGKVDSDRSVHIVYRGKPLRSRTRCYWKVRVWDRGGRPSDFYGPATWSMGLLNMSDWKPKWIGFDEALDAVPAEKLIKGSKEKVYLPCPHLRKQFALEKPVRRATIYATALGVYELRINGRRVGKDYFTPGWTDYNQRIYYRTYDVTDLLRRGDNAIGAILSDGWYAGNISNLGQRFYGTKLRLLAQMHVEYTDGTRDVVVTDETWKAMYGPIREADMQAGETYDARLELPGWDQPGFDDRQAKPVTLRTRIETTSQTQKGTVPFSLRENRGSPQAAIEAYPGVPVQKRARIEPVWVKEPKPGVTVFNLGQNFAGWARLKVRGPAGAKVVMRFGEMLNADGTVYTENLRSARATDTYILKGQGDEVWEPKFTFHGFQYVQVTGYPGKPPRDAITGIVVHSKAPLSSSFECSDAMLNRLYSNIVWSQRSNYFEVPTDCPQRDERMGWTGDAQVFVRTATYNMDVAAFFTKWLVDLEDAQYDHGAFPAMAPRPHDMISPGWGDAGIICPWTMYRVYGDKRILQRHYDAMTRWIDYLQKRSEGDLSKHDGFGDWLNVDAETPKEVIATAYFAYSTRLMSEIARVLGKETDARKYDELLGRIKRAFAKAYVAEDGKVHGDTQTAYLMALHFDLLPPDKRKAATELLIERIRQRNWHLSCGFLGVNLLLPTLTEIGRTDVAYRLLLNETYPSWGYSIANGATTVWERWNSYTKERGFGDVSMNSFNHYAYGSAGEWMFTTLAGIDTDGPGFKRILIRPRPGGGLKYAKAGYRSIHGRIATHWQQTNNGLRLDVTIPANTRATVYVPAKEPNAVTESGRPAAESPGVVARGTHQRNAVFEVESGRYSFLAP